MFVPREGFLETVEEELGAALGWDLHDAFDAPRDPAGKHGNRERSDFGVGEWGNGVVGADEFEHRIEVETWTAGKRPYRAGVEVAVALGTEEKHALGNIE